ncbi:uncharacterized protein LOC123552448 isoform X2 [Mercenaria mercenaria]|uniref:uncharacterized protein LOC123552448 isoform X2 n=1 Tax=Mercenaria mercenaria TaxID=6596 RepID=UPI00234F6F70|nr:uncharacterized protein LOC123552448 isoform X2 [Mercenaria mercenaria]
MHIFTAMSSFTLYLIVTLLTPCSLTSFPFKNISLPWADRVNDIVKRLTLTELKDQLARGGSGPQGGPARAIPRLGIGPYQWNEECLRGIAFMPNATAFPQAIGLAATFSPSLIFDIAEAIGKEVRAKHNDYIRKKDYGDHTGLSCFSPVINIMRHPLWGRNQETYGEDPYFSGIYAENYVKGLQGNHERYVRASAGCKHFAVHGGPDNIPTSRFNFDAKVSDRDMRLTFLPAFRACVRAGTYSLMCSFNRLNGVPACANHDLLTKILREEWDFQGYVVSDEGALDNMINRQDYFNTTVETTVAGIKAGCNLELSWEGAIVYDAVVEAVRTGLLSETLVRERVKPLFYTRMRLGEFDPPEMNPYLQYNMSTVQSPAHQQLAVKAAMQSFVLLKNDNNLLPIRHRLERVAIIGPMADNLKQLYGDYSPIIDAKYARTPLQGLRNIATTVNHTAGCEDNKCKTFDADAVRNVVSDVQLVIICIGTGQEIEAEAKDRQDMNLPGNQNQLVLDAVESANGSSVLLLVFSAGPVNISFVDRDPRVEAIMQCFFPAQAAGEALYNTITMATEDASPAGRLPYTWYDTADQIPSMTDYTMTGRTYRYFKGTPLYPFGYGLSYSEFRYSKLTVQQNISTDDNQLLSGYVENIGSIDAFETVQVYISWLTTTVAMPNIQLTGLQKIYIKSGAKIKFQFVIDNEQFAVWTDKGFVVQPGMIQVYVGGQQPRQVKNVGSNVLQATFEISSKTSDGTLIYSRRMLVLMLIFIFLCFQYN